MRRLSLLFLLLIFVSGAGCKRGITPPKEFDFKPVSTIHGNYDSVWAAVVEFFAATNLPIKTIEKDSGLITSNWIDAMKMTGAKVDSICNCGEAGGLIKTAWTNGKFSVYVKKNR